MRMYTGSSPNYSYIYHETLCACIDCTRLNESVLIFIYQRLQVSVDCIKKRKKANIQISQCKVLGRLKRDTETQFYDTKMSQNLFICCFSISARNFLISNFEINFISSTKYKNIEHALLHLKKKQSNTFQEVNTHFKKVTFCTRIPKKKRSF